MAKKGNPFAKAAEMAAKAKPAKKGKGKVVNPYKKG